MLYFIERKKIVVSLAHQSAVNKKVPFLYDHLLFVNNVALLKVIIVL